MSLCDGYHTVAIVLKLGRGLPNPLEEPVVKPYHTWLSESAHALTLPLSLQLRNYATAMKAGTEAGTETFGSSISADEDTEKEVAQPEADGPEQPVKPSVEKNASPRPEKPIHIPEAAGPETRRRPSRTRCYQRLRGNTR